jgi:SAM-dependent methyltransferase
MAEGAAEDVWDARAREHALFFVDNRVDYRQPDVDAFWAGGEEALEKLLAAVGEHVGPSDVVVDIGCGVGRLTRALATRAREVVGIDISAEMLTQAQRLNAGLTNVRWVHGDGRRLTGVGDEEADACVSHVVFQHIPDPAVTLGYVREIGRVLRPGGWAAFVVSTDPSVHRPRRLPARVVWRLAAAAGRGPKAQEHSAWLGSAVRVEDLERAAHDGGLRVERLLGRGSQFTTVLARRNPSAGAARA